MARRSGLGRGLGALIPTDITGEAGFGPPGGAGRVDRAEPAPATPATSTRRRWPASPRRSPSWACCSPILVRELPDDRFELIAGERRWRAAKRAGLPSIPVVVRTVGRGAVARAGAGGEPPPRGPQPARGGGRLPAADGGLRASPRSRSRRRSASPARRSPTPSACSSCRRRSSGWSPRTSSPPATRRRCSAPPIERSRRRWPSGSWPRACRCARPRRPCRRHGRPDDEPRTATAPPAPTEASRPQRATPKRLRPPGLLELEELLADHLVDPGQASPWRGQRRGKIVIEFAGLEDLERIYRAMTEAAPPEP